MLIVLFHGYELLRLAHDDLRLLNCIARLLLMDDAEHRVIFQV